MRKGKLPSWRHAALVLILVPVACSDAPGSGEGAVADVFPPGPDGGAIADVTDVEGAADSEPDGSDDVGSPDGAEDGTPETSDADVDGVGDAPTPDLGPPLDTAKGADPPDIASSLDAAGAPDTAADANPGDTAADAPAPDGTVAPDGQDEDAGPSDPEMYTVDEEEGCAIPTDFESLGCMVVDCADGSLCLGDGHCVPQGPYPLESDPTLRQVKPALAEALGGGYAASWYDVVYPPGTATKTMDVHFQMFDAVGTPTTNKVKVDQDSMAYSRSPSMTPMEGGGFLVVWREQEGISSGDIAYMARIMSPDGLPVGDEFILNQTPLTHGSIGSNVDSPFPKLLRSGSIAVTWMGSPPEATQASDVYLRVLTPTGQYQTDELDTGGNTTAYEVSPVVTDTLQGGVAIYWHHWQSAMGGKPGQPAQEAENFVRGRIFDAFAVPVGGPFQVTPGTDVKEGSPSAATFVEGDMIVTWKSSNTEITTSGTSARSTLLGDEGQDIGSLAHLVGTDPLGNYPFYAPVAVAGPRRAVVAWHTVDALLDGVYLRRYYADDDVYDCDATKIPEGLLPLETGTRRLPAVLGFADGRILVAWNASFANPGGGASLTRAYLQYLK